MNDIEALAERILLIGKGKILYDGDLNKLRSRFGTNKPLRLSSWETAHYPKYKELKYYPGCLKGKLVY